MLGLNLLDIILLIFLVVAAWKGARSGLTRSLLHLAAIVTGTIAGFMYAPELAARLDTQWGLIGRVEGFVGKVVHLPVEAMSASISTSSSRVQALIGNLGLPAPLESALRQYANTSPPPGPNHASLGAVVYNAIALMLVKALAFILIFLAVWVVVQILIMVLTPVVRGSFLRLPDSLGGALLGLLSTGLFLTLAFGVLSPFLSMSFLEPVTGLVEGSRLASLFLKAYYAISPLVPGGLGIMNP